MRGRALLAFAALLFGAISCRGASGGPGGPGTGLLRLALTDAPLAASGVTAVNVCLDRVDAVMGDDGPIHRIDVHRTFDLLSLRDGVTAPLGIARLPVGAVTQLRLVLCESGAAVVMGSATFPVEVPSGSETGVKLDAPGGIEIRGSATTTVVLDFDAEASLHHAPGRGWMLTPVVRIVERAIDPGGPVRIATPHGTPLEPAPVTATLSSAGGTFSSADGKVKVTVPAGAVAAPTELTVTSIANKATGGVGAAVRLGPEGTTFAVPVTLTFEAPRIYPDGTSIDGVGIEYQDARGFWYRVEPAMRNSTLKTVSVETTHFSDWALTWQGGTAAAEGPITLVQRVTHPLMQQLGSNIPFTATGRAAVYFQEDTATETYYSLTGTLTVPASIPFGTATCVPDAVTKTLPLNLAEVHKATSEFHWGINVHWMLTCTWPDTSVTTELMATSFDTMYGYLTSCLGAYAPGQIVSADQLAGRYTKDCGGDGVYEVDGGWDLRACLPDQECAVPGECRFGLTECSAGIQSCVDSGPAPDGTPCTTAGGAPGTCTGGACG
jgi:hypothetical protein